ncbi:MAG: prolipoprotein diacylglyceryl transferase [Gemmatimonadetes bacterium]|nr:prolipoprotein diacylglyceryl transferase [Gemmatimonadota bacterium]
MTFPFYLRLGPLTLHPHAVFETLGCFLGFRLYVHLRRRRGDAVGDQRRLVLLAAAVAGAVVGSKVLAWLDHPQAALAAARAGTLLAAGKTIVGGLLGGLVAVELAKRRMKVTAATGDLYVFPLLLAIAVGRVGCFLTGLGDDTYGLPTRLPWGVDFGDGIPRHPTQLYEIAFLAALALALHGWSRVPRAAGDAFKLFMATYLAWRLAVDFLKPMDAPFLGVSAIQLACVAGLAYYAPHLPRLLGRRQPVPA